MKFTVFFLCLLLIFLLKSYQCLANESPLGKRVSLQGLIVSKGDDIRGEDCVEKKVAVQRLSHTSKGGGGKGRGKSNGGGNSQVERQPPHRKSNASPCKMTPFRFPLLVSCVTWLVTYMCVLVNL